MDSNDKSKDIIKIPEIEDIYFSKSVIEKIYNNDSIEDKIDAFKANAKKGLITNSWKQMTERENMYSELLRNFIDQYEEDTKFKNNKKECMFNLILFFFSFLFILGFVLIIICIVLSFKDEKTANIIILLFGAILSMSTSLVSIPIIIVKHLFPDKIDNRMVDIVQTLSSCDLRKFLKDDDKEGED